MRGPRRAGRRGWRRPRSDGGRGRQARSLARRPNDGADTADIAVALGLTGIALSWALAYAQWHRARRATGGISVLSWAAFLTVNAVWCVYAVAMRNPFLVANVVGAAALNVALLRRIDPHLVRTVVIVVAAVALSAVLGLTVGWPVVAVECFVIAFFVRWPQLLTAFTAADLSGVSVTSWLVAFVNNSIWIVIGLQRHDPWFAAANVALAASTAVLVSVVAVRRARPARAATAP